MYGRISRLAEQLPFHLLNDKAQQDGRILQAIWSDVFVSAISKMGFWSKATGEVVNSLSDFTIDKGYRSTILGTKDWDSTAMDLMFEL